MFEPDQYIGISISYQEKYVCTFKNVKDTALFFFIIITEV